tara:strand:+ start:234 stop:431 length:198 start_codon:yes stop_codon:yes gene_type:complete
MAVKQLIGPNFLGAGGGISFIVTRGMTPSGEEGEVDSKLSYEISHVISRSIDHEIEKHIPHAKRD